MSLKYNSSKDIVPFCLVSTIKSSITASISSICSTAVGFKLSLGKPPFSSQIPVRIRVLLIIETSCPEPVSPRFGSNSFRSKAATILFLLLFAVAVISFLFIASLLITGVSEYTSSQITDINSVKAAFLEIATSLPL